MTNHLNPAYPIHAVQLRVLTTQPVRWVTVIRQGETLDAVLRYVADWPTYPLGSDGIFLVCVPASQARFTVDRLASGLFYAKAHDTYGDAEADAVDQAMTLIR